MRKTVSLAVVLAALFAGCGGDDEPAPSEDGVQRLFSDNCGNCHTLAAASTGGKVGPNLDQLRPSVDLVKSQVTNGGGGMPAFERRLSADEIQQISDYVAENAGS